MNKTWKTILQVISYIIAAILGAAGEAVMMEEVRRKMEEVRPTSYGT